MNSSNNHYYLLWALALLLMLNGCVSHQYSNIRQGEEFLLVVNENPNGIFSESDVNPQVAPNRSTGSRGLMSDVISLATEGVKTIIEMDQRKYTASYSSARQHLYFYNYISEQNAIDPGGIQMESIELIRFVNTGVNQRDTALYVRMVVDTDNLQELINNSIFRLKIEAFKLNYAKAKIPGYAWYLPWTNIYKNQESVNLDLELNFSSSWMYESGNMESNRSIGKFMLGLRNIPLDKASPAYEKFCSDIVGSYLDGYSFLVPRSFGNYVTPDGQYKACYGQGHYNISATIKEAGKEHFITRVVQENSQTAIKEIRSNLIRLVD